MLWEPNNNSKPRDSIPIGYVLKSKKERDSPNRCTRDNETFWLFFYVISFFFICRIYSPLTRKQIVSLYLGRVVRISLGVAISKMAGHLSLT